MHQCIENLKKESIMKKNEEKKIYEIPVTWEVYGKVEVEATSIKEAYEKVKKDEEDMALPTESYYVDGTFKNSFDTFEEFEEYKHIYEK
jgi:hypothetical protein